MPLLSDDDGHTIGGGETGDGDESAVAVQRALDAGLFVQVEEAQPEAPMPDAKPDASAKPQPSKRGAQDRLTSNPDPTAGNEES